MIKIKVFNKSNGSDLVDQGYESVTYADNIGIYSDSIRVVLATHLQKQVELGDVLELSINEQDLGSYQISKLSSANYRINIHASCISAAHQEIKSKTYDKQSLKSLVGCLADEAQLDFKVAQDIADTSVETLHRLNSTPLSFVSQVADNLGCKVRIIKKCLIMYRKEQPTFKDIPTYKINNYISMNTDSCLIKKYDCIKVPWFNHENNRLRYETAGAGAKVYQHKQRCKSQSLARKKAESLLHDNVTRNESISLELELDLSLCAGLVVSAHESEYTVESVTHSMRAGVYRTTLSGFKKGVPKAT